MSIEGKGPLTKCFGNNKNSFKVSSQNEGQTLTRLLKFI